MGDPIPDVIMLFVSRDGLFVLRKRNPSEKVYIGCSLPRLKRMRAQSLEQLMDESMLGPKFRDAASYAARQAEVIRSEAEDIDMEYLWSQIQGSQSQVARAVDGSQQLGGVESPDDAGSKAADDDNDHLLELLEGEESGGEKKLPEAEDTAPVQHSAPGGHLGDTAEANGVAPERVPPATDAAEHNDGKIDAAASLTDQQAAAAEEEPAMAAAVLPQPDLPRQAGSATPLAPTVVDSPSHAPSTSRSTSSTSGGVGQTTGVRCIVMTMSRTFKKPQTHRVCLSI